MDDSRVPASAAGNRPDRRRAVRISWWGDSLVACREAHNPRLIDQLHLPPVGTLIEVTGYRHRGFAAAVATGLQARFCTADVQSTNFAAGGATSADTLAAIESADPAHSWHLAVLGCGTNDVWGMKQRPEAADTAAYQANITAALDILTHCARTVLMLGLPPMGALLDADTAAANRALAGHNAAARAAAAGAGARFIDVWERFTATAAALGWAPSTPAGSRCGATLWQEDGVHLSDLGNHLVSEAILAELRAWHPLN